MNPKQLKKKQKAHCTSHVTSLSWIKEEAEEHLNPNFESLEQIVHEVPKPLESEELVQDQSTEKKNRKSNRCKRSRNSKKVQITPPNERNEPFERLVNLPIEEVTVGNRESLSKKKHKKNKKNKKYKNKEKCSQKKELQKSEKLWEQWAPQPLPVSIASAKAKRKKCLLSDSPSVKVSDENLIETKHKEQRHEDKALKAVNKLRVKSKMVYKYLCLPTSQKSVCSPADEKEMQQGEATCTDWEETSCTEIIAQDTLRNGRPADSLHCGIRNPFRQSCADTSRPKASFDMSLLRQLRCLTSPHSHPTEVYGNRGLAYLKTSKDAQVVKRSPEFTEDDGNSQDLFITQKKFLPFAQPDNNSGYSVEEIVDEHCDKQLRSPDARHLRFSSPPPTDMSDLFRSGLKSPKSRSSEKGTQTSDFFGSPAFATSLRFYQKVKEELCSEEPVDLSLPTRVRAKNSTHLKNIPDSPHAQKNSITPPRQHTPLHLSTPEGRSTCQLLPLFAYSDRKKHSRRYDDGKFVQTILNESYFFKVKGQGKPKDPRMPLLKKKRDKRTEKQCDWS
ncbi:uncharacterized protein LOC119971013 [Scyliorhinus canicula]|uniref:uncharacterized protein LOC119971013 n=1 Tax=Scyliorhinus canicula TaxID=7830 RepID=UPI0018F3AD84|nr:uncharacterized protein LOC119971013 [Scyliorhinus canicula]